MMKLMPLKKVKSSEKMTKKVLSQIERTKMIHLRVCYKIWSGSQSQTNKTRRNFVSKLKSLKTICLPTCSRYSTNLKAILLVVKSRTRSSRTKLSRSVLWTKQSILWKASSKIKFHKLRRKSLDKWTRQWSAKFNFLNRFACS